MIKEVTKEAAQMTPPVAVTATAIMGFSLQEWVYIATIIYTVIQIARLFPKMYGCAVCCSRKWECKRNCKE